MNVDEKDGSVLIRVIPDIRVRLREFRERLDSKTRGELRAGRV